MRLIGLGVLALLLFALIALLVDSREEILTSVGLHPEGGGREITVLETGSAPLPDTLKGAAGTAKFPIRQYDKWTALAGFSSNQTFTLPLPRQTPFSAAVLYLEIQAELEETTTGRMRFAINRKNRGEVVLDPGSHGHLVKIPLEPLDMARDWVEVTMSVLGNNPKAECTSDWTGGVVVTVEPSTHVQVALDEEIMDIEDQFILSGSPTRIVWQGAEPAKTIDVSPAWQWRPFARDARFVATTEAKETDVVANLAELSGYRERKLAEFRLKQDLDGIADVAWPISLAKAKVGLSREFRNRTTWVFDYARADMPNRELPDLLDLRLTAVSSDATASWLLLVTLNGQIVHSEQVAAAQELLDRQIALPVGIQALQNQLKVTLTSDEEKEGRCVQGRPAAAQIKAGTALNHTGAPAMPVFAGLLDAVTPQIDLEVSDKLTAEAANFGFYAMSNIFVNNTFHVGQAEDGRNVAKLMAGDDISSFRDGVTHQAGPLWFAFAAITDEDEPQVFAFKGNDPQLGTALEVFDPASVLVVGPPDFGF